MFTRLVPLTYLAVLAAGLAHAAATTRPAIESWSDVNLPVKKNLTLWVDARHQPTTFSDSSPIATLHDASGHARHFTQSKPDAQPRFAGGAIRFDGRDDFLRCASDHPPLTDFTIVLIAAPRSNRGEFRAFFA